MLWQLKIGTAQNSFGGKHVLFCRPHLQATSLMCITLIFKINIIQINHFAFQELIYVRKIDRFLFLSSKGYNSGPELKFPQNKFPELISSKDKLIINFKTFTIFTSILFKHLLLLFLLKYSSLSNSKYHSACRGFFSAFFLGWCRKIDISHTYLVVQKHSTLKQREWKNRKHVYKEKASLQAEDSVAPA